MENFRLADKSLHYYLENQLNTIWGSFLSVKDSYPNTLEEITVPLVSVDYTTGRLNPLEIGTDENEDIMYFMIDIFARGKSERDDLLYIIMNLLSSGCNVVQFSGGSAGANIGHMYFEDISARPMYAFGPDIPTKVAYRAEVSTKATYTITGQ